MGNEKRNIKKKKKEICSLNKAVKKKIAKKMRKL